MIVYPCKVSSEYLVDDVGTSVNHHRNDPKVTYLINTHIQITDKKCKVYAYRVYARGTRGVYEIKCIKCMCIAFLWYPFTMSIKSLFIQHAKIQQFLQIKKKFANNLANQKKKTDIYHRYINIRNMKRIKLLIFVVR